MIARAAVVAGGLALLAGCSAILGLGSGTIAESSEAGPGDDGATSGGPDGAGAGSDGGGSANDSGQNGPPPSCDGTPGTCLTFTPSAGIPASDLDGTGLKDFVLTVHDDAGFDTGDAGDGGPAPGDTVIDVDTGEITAGGVVLRPASTGNPANRDVQANIAYRQTDQNIAVFTFLSLTVPAGTTLKLVGQHAVALLSSTTLVVDGAIDARPMNPDGSDVCGPNAAIAPGGFAGGAGEVKGHQGIYSAPGGGSGPGGGGGGPSASGGGGGHASGGGAGCESDRVGRRVRHLRRRGRGLRRRGARPERLSRRNRAAEAAACRRPFTRTARTEATGAARSASSPPARSQSRAGST